MAGHREQPPRQVLPVDSRRPAPARTTSRALEPGLVRGQKCPGGRMTLLHRLASIVRWMFRRNQAERDLNDEMAAFVDMAAANEIRDGATLAEARRRATIQLEGLEQAKAAVRARP